MSSFDSTILRCARCSTDRRAIRVAKTNCVALSMTYRKTWIAGNQSQAVGSLKFHNWMPLKALGWRFDTLSFESREDTRKWVLQLRRLMIWTEKTILILKDGCNVSAVVQFTSHKVFKTMKSHIWDSCRLELVPPGCHHRNAAEVGIWNFKNHFPSILAGVADGFSLSLWDCLLPPTKITLNPLHQSNATPTVSA